MPSRRLAVVLLAAALLAVWWASGLGGPQVDARRFFSPEEIVRARRYQLPRYGAFALGTAIGLGVLATLAFTRAGDVLLRPVRGWPWPLAAAGAAVLVAAAGALARLPVSFWRGYLHERAWGFSTQSVPGWVGDWAKAVGISALLGAAVMAGLFAAIRLLPRSWPAVAALGGALLVAGLSYLGPLVFEPLFNRFTPLPDRELAAELRGLAERAGVPVREVLVADASRRTTKENAYVSGFGATRRLVVYDNLLRKAPREEVVLVVAHELGHRRARHVEWGTLLGAGGAAASVLVLWGALRSGAILRAVGADGPGDVRLVPVILLVIAVLQLAALPPANWLSRRWEAAADRFALELTGERDVYVATERGLALRNLADLSPGPIAYRFLFTHPAPGERIAMAFESAPGTGPP